MQLFEEMARLPRGLFSGKIRVCFLSKTAEGSGLNALARGLAGRSAKGDEKRFPAQKACTYGEDWKIMIK